MNNCELQLHAFGHIDKGKRRGQIEIYFHIELINTIINIFLKSYWHNEVNISQIHPHLHSPQILNRYVEVIKISTETKHLGQQYAYFIIILSYFIISVSVLPVNST